MRALSLGLLLAGGLLCACAGDPITRAQEQADDEAARVEHFETAAVTYYDGGRYDLAEIQFRRVIELKPDDKKAKRGLAKSLYMQASSGRLSRVERARKLREAQGLLEKIVNLDWPNPGPRGGSRRYEVQTDLAYVLADLADLYDRDIRDLRRALRTAPSAEDKGYTGTISIQVQKRNDLLHKAIPLFKAVLRASPENQYALTGLAKSYLQLGEDEQGIKYARRYLKLSQRSQHGWKDKLDEYAEALGGMNKVTDEQRQWYLTKIHGAREKEKKMHLMLASVHMRRGEFGQAVTAYSRVIKMDSAIPAAYLERAQGYAALQQYQLAVNDLERYLKITDPARHRSQRLNAVELLDRYQSAVSRRGAPPVRDSGDKSRPGDSTGSPDGDK